MLQLGENKALKWLCKQVGIGVNFEYTMPDTPKQNEWMESKFVTQFNLIHTMLNNGKLSNLLQNRLWAIQSLRPAI